jgi:NADH:ubiquinone oxidoreductase subunit 5 (subunit L)/multisubunit Na+/H+ antiporter MnhA subunit
MFKGLLFMCAGSILHAVHTRQMDKLGGLIKQMPWTGAMFAVGSVAICGLPPLNGFIGEFLLYLGAYKGCIFNGLGSLVPSITIICSLALIGGFAVAGFTKVFGTVFLGESRSESTVNAHEAGPSMRFAMLIPACACLVLGIGAPYIINSLRFAIMQAAGVEESISAGQLYGAALISKKIVFVSLGLMVLIIAVRALRNRLLRNRIVKTAPTWDCGYARPNARIQYTASSFTQPITEMATMILRTKRKRVQFDSMLPKEQDFETSTPEPGKQYLFGPLFRMSDFAMDKMRFLQQGSVQLYVLYIAVTLILLLLWKL